MLGILIVLNNYFHDVATAVLLSSAVVMFVIAKYVGDNPGEELKKFFISAYGAISKFAIIALVWIVIGGIPRTIFFTRFEWPTAIGRGIVLALVVKHVFMFSAVGAGAILWLRLRQKVVKFSLEIPPNPPLIKGGDKDLLPQGGAEGLSLEQDTRIEQGDY